MLAYDFSKHIDQTIIETEAAKLSKIKARREVAAKRHAEALDLHEAAKAAHANALTGHTDEDPFDTQQRVNDGQPRLPRRNRLSRPSKGLLPMPNLNTCTAAARLGFRCIPPQRGI